VTSRAVLLAHASTPATATAAFPADEPLEARGRARAAAVRDVVPRADHVRRAPGRACRETCAALGLNAESDDRLRVWDLGGWAGRPLDEVAATYPAEVHAWLTDPAAAPHGGEPLTALLARVAGWLAAPPAGRALVVCGPAVVRAAVVTVLGAPPAAFWRIDVAPLSATDLRGGPERWTVRATGAALPGPTSGPDL
jgi:broad specificity phosphatase PhoE